jgi:hypothetical protein
LKFLTQPSFISISEVRTAGSFLVSALALLGYVLLLHPAKEAVKAIASKIEIAFFINIPPFYFKTLRF